MPELGRITATVDVLPYPPSTGATGFKVRVVVWSGPDFSWPTMKRGGRCEDEATANHLAERCRDACRTLGIPVEGDEPRGDHSRPFLPEIPEGSEYPLVD